MSDYSVLFVCLGNICRSPLADAVLRHKVAAAGLSDRIAVDSCGTSSYHEGEPPNPMSAKVARRHGIDMSTLRSRQLRRADLHDFDLLVAMDASNKQGIERLGTGRVVMMRDYDPAGSGDVPDPWGGGPRGFDLVYEIIDRSCEVLLRELRDELGV
jgi:protein-tyrosine phosphatase